MGLLKKIRTYALAGTLLFPSINTISHVPKQFDSRKIIVIDPGHGRDNQKPNSIDYGAEQPGGREAEVVLNYARYIEENIDHSKYKVILTRNGHLESTPLEDRILQANLMNAGLYISLHLDSFRNKYVKGTTIFQNEQGKDFGKILEKQIIREFPTKNRGRFTQGKRQGWQTVDYAILRLANIPSTLVELGFLSNRQDRLYLLNDENHLVENTIIKSIDEYFSYKEPRKTILIDPGHGMGNRYRDLYDPGALNKNLNLKEEEIVFNQAKTLENLADKQNYEILLTRKDMGEKGENTSLEDRRWLAKKLKPDAFISIHLNDSKNKNDNGFEIIYGMHPKSRELAKYIFAELKKLPNLNKRSFRRGKELRILSQYAAPSVIVEPGFIKNKKDLESILDSIPDIEQAIQRGYENFFKKNKD